MPAGGGATTHIQQSSVVPHRPSTQLRTAPTPRQAFSSLIRRVQSADHEEALRLGVQAMTEVTSPQEQLAAERRRAEQANIVYRSVAWLAQRLSKAAEASQQLIPTSYRAVMDDNGNKMSKRKFCFHVGVMLCGAAAGGWAICQMLWVL